MSLQRVFKLEFNYLNEMFAAKVFHANYADGCMLYKVNIKAGKYWFLKYQDTWRVFGDFKLNKKLEFIIISNIERISQHAHEWNTQTMSASMLHNISDYQ